MATVTITGGASAPNGFDMGVWSVSFIMGLLADPNTIAVGNSSEIAFINGSVTMIVDGTFVIDGGGALTGGTVNSFSYTSPQFAPTSTIAVSGLAIPVTSIYGWVQTNNFTAFQSAVFDANDTFTGDNNNSVIIGYGGADTINGNGGNDRLVGDLGNDTLNGGDGSDQLDYLVSGNVGNDILNGGNGDDFIGSNGVDTIDGGAGTDLLSISLTTGNVNISTAQTSSDTGVTLANGTFVKNVELLTLSTGNGDDTLTITTAAGSVSIGAAFFAGNGTDTLAADLSASSASFTLTGPDGPSSIGNFAGYSFDSIERFNVTTGSGADLLTGGTLDDFLSAGAGNDALAGGAGNDTLNGGDGNDEIDGGAGADIINGGDGNDTITSGGGDTIDGGAGIDLLIYNQSSSTANETITALGGGATLPDGSHIQGFERFQISTGSGNDILDAGNGADGVNTFNAGTGNDRLIIDLSALATPVTLNQFLGDIVSGTLTFHTSSVEEYYITGGSGNDNIDGGAGGDALNGGAGNDFLAGYNGNDQLDGGDGNDTLLGYAGVNVMSGGLGDDWISSVTAGDTVDGGAGVDFAVFDRGSATSAFTIDATSLAGSSFVNLGDGTLVRNIEKLDLYTGSGNDVFTVTAFNPGIRLLAGGGSNTLAIDLTSSSVGLNISLSEVYDGVNAMTFAGMTTLYATGGSGNDHVVGGSGNDVLHGGAGNDSVGGNAGLDYVYGDAGDDTLSGTAEFGGEGDDTLYVVAYAEGGDGNDTYYVDVTGTNVIEALNGGSDTVISSLDYAMTANVETLMLTGTAHYGVGSATDNTIVGNNQANELQGLDGNDTLQGGAGIDLLYGQNGNDNLQGQNDNDALIGDAGNDALDGGAGQDYLLGGIGDDTYYVDDIGDYPIENSGEGNDTIYASASYAMTLNVETMYLTGFAPYGVGNVQDNIIYGNNSFNELQGLDGNDTLHGADGDDLLYGQNGNDSLYGEVGNDALIGGIGNDVLDGGTGVDYLLGGDGNDTYYVDASGDNPLESVGEGTDTIYSAISYTMTANTEIMYLTNNAPYGVGNSGDNTIYGNSVSNQLTGLGGNDTLVGGGGTDFLYGGSGADTFLYQAASDAAPANLDAIMDFEIGIDKIDLRAVRTGASDAFSFTTSGGNTFLHVDLGGDGSEDMLINIFAVTGVAAGDVLW